MAIKIQLVASPANGLFLPANGLGSRLAFPQASTGRTSSPPPGLTLICLAALAILEPKGEPEAVMPVSPETVGAATEALGVEGMSRVGRRARVIWDNVYTIKTNRMECKRPTPLRKIGEAWRLKNQHVASQPNGNWQDSSS